MEGSDRDCEMGEIKYVAEVKKYVGDVPAKILVTRHARLVFSIDSVALPHQPSRPRFVLSVPMRSDRPAPARSVRFILTEPMRSLHPNRTD